MRGEGRGRSVFGIRSSVFGRTPNTEYRIPNPQPPTSGASPQPITFSFNGRPIAAYKGDSVAAALYAAGVRIFTRSFKYHRPRGLLCCAGRCPNSLMNVDGAPNIRTCVTPARE